MKNLLLVLVALFALTACKDSKKGLLDPNSKISIRPAEGVQMQSPVSRANPAHLTAREIVLQTWEIEGVNRDEIRGLDSITRRRGFSKAQRDTIENRLLMFGTDVISQNGYLNTGFISDRNITLTRLISPAGEPWVVDTIAYIPNKTVIDAEKAIHIAYDSQNYTECYRLFDQAFRFIPITGAEYRYLKIHGLH